jgi:signal transduction histidine kinase
VRETGIGVLTGEFLRQFVRLYRVDKAHSRELGRGFTFSFTLPVHDLGLA